MNVKVLRETHQTPAHIERRVTHSGGTNRFGDPNFRVVWGWNRLSWIGGLMRENDASGNFLKESLHCTREPKYWNCVNRWLVEKWCPPEMYGSPEAWYRDTAGDKSEGFVPQLGPYPYRGDYELSFVVQKPNGEFLQLTPTIVDELIKRIRFGDTNKKATRMSLYDREHKAIEDYKEWAFEMMADTATYVATPHSYPYQNVSHTVTGRTL